MQIRASLQAAAFLALAPLASSQALEHFWDFTTMADLASGVPTTGVGTPDLSVHATYGEAYPGAGPSLNTLIGGIPNGSGYLSAAVFTGPVPAMNYGLDSFSFSYWVWDDFASDNDANGPRIFDNLAGTTTGIQLATNLPGNWNLRTDDDAGGANIFDQFQQVRPATDRWVHIVGVVDRTAGEVRLFVDGALAASAPLLSGVGGAALVGNVAPTQDLDIGAINGGMVAGQAQTLGLDDLAFYRGVLSAGDAAALASGGLSPLAFSGFAQRYCSPNVVNTSGSSARLFATGSPVAQDNDVRLTAIGMPANQFGFFLTSQTQGLVMNPGGSQGNLCLAGTIGRYVASGQIKNAGAAGAFELDLDLTLTPAGSVFVQVTAGQTWNFQTWFRDIGPGGAPWSNFTDALSLQFQ